jgi:DNA repair exonuclease SbcCD ATPase subunit
MAEVLGIVASAIAVIQLSEKVGTLCIQYSKAVWNAKSDIKRLQDRVKTLNTTAKSVKRLLEGPDAAAFETVQELVDSLSGSLTLLKQLQDRLDSDKARKPMSLIGFRALKWPYARKEIQAVIASLENHEQTISHALQLDHM